MSRVNGLLLAMCLNGMACGVAAQEAYVAGGIGSSDWSFDDCGTTGCDGSTSSWRVAVGYRFSRAFALEGFYFNYRCARASSFSLDGELCGTALGVQALLGYQFGAVDFAGKVGLAEVRSDFRASDTSFYSSSVSRSTVLSLGLMAAYRFTPNLALRLDVDTVPVGLNTFWFQQLLGLKVDGAEVTTITLGVMVRF
jgi:hypothetical protein